MRINEYKRLEDFIYEYDSGRCSSDENHKRKFMGIEFLYDGIYYRMCREPLEHSESPKLENSKPGFYQVYVMHCKKFGYPVADEFENVGCYGDIYDLLENCTIGNKKFKDVIMDDKTEILSQD